MSSVTVTVKGHWISAWIMYPFARPYVVINGVETKVRWGRPQTFAIASSDVHLGAGIRYFNRGPLFGHEPRALESPDVRTGAFVLRNGFWNHQPFVAIRV